MLQHWAAPGGRHDRRIILLKRVLPIVTIILAALLAIAPFTHQSEVSFVLDKKKVDMSAERLKVVEALYRGEDSQGRPFSLRAGSAVQKSSREPIVQLNDLEARLQMDNGGAPRHGPARHLRSRQGAGHGQWPDPIRERQRLPVGDARRPTSPCPSAPCAAAAPSKGAFRPARSAPIISMPIWRNALSRSTVAPACASSNLAAKGGDAAPRPPPVIRRRPCGACWVPC